MTGHDSSGALPTRTHKVPGYTFWFLLAHAADSYRAHNLPGRDLAANAMGSDWMRGDPAPPAFCCLHHRRATATPYGTHHLLHHYHAMPRSRYTARLPLLPMPVRRRIADGGPWCVLPVLFWTSYFHHSASTCLDAGPSTTAHAART